MRICMRMIKYVPVATDDAWRKNVDATITRILEDIQKIKLAMLDEKSRKVWENMMALKEKQHFTVRELQEIIGSSYSTARTYIKTFEKIGLVEVLKEDE